MSNIHITTKHLFIGSLNAYRDLYIEIMHSYESTSLDIFPVSVNCSEWNGLC